MPNKVYDILKWFVILFLPALAKFIEPFFGIWGIPYGPQISESIQYIQIFLGSILCVSAIQYKFASKKTEEVKPNDGE